VGLKVYINLHVVPTQKLPMMRSILQISIDKFLMQDLGCSEVICNVVLFAARESFWGIEFLAAEGTTSLGALCFLELLLRSFWDQLFRFCSIFRFSRETAEGWSITLNLYGVFGIRRWEVSQGDSESRVKLGCNLRQRPRKQRATKDGAPSTTQLS